MGVVTKGFSIADSQGNLKRLVLSCLLMGFCNLFIQGYELSLEPGIM